MSVRRSLFFLSLFLIGVPLVLLWRTQSPRASNQNPLSNVQIYTVDIGEVSSVVSAVGQIEADQVIKLSLLTGGRVAEVFVSVGEFVAKDTPLLRLENETQRLAYEQAVLELQKAELQYSLLLAP
ncbi:MAG: hypothetical protein CUN52_09815, partial [Phototrophicales bacterium]